MYLHFYFIYLYVKLIYLSIIIIINSWYLVASHLIWGVEMVHKLTGLI